MYRFLRTLHALPSFGVAVVAAFALAPAWAAGTLTAIDVAPVNPALTVGDTLSMSATGHFSDRPDQPLQNSAVVMVAPRYDDGCALFADGTVKCWGENGSGQLGNGSTRDSTDPVSVLGITNATALAFGGGHACAVLATGEIRCWGSNNEGQLGDGTTLNSSVPVTVVGIDNGMAVAIHGSSTCAALRDGHAKCWGRNRNGQLGDGTYTDTSVPVDVIGIDNARAMSMGYLSACALLDTGEVRCWGSNNTGQLGNGTFIPSPVPVAVIGLDTATVLVQGEYHVCVLLTNGEVQCWGDNGYSELGIGTHDPSTVPVTVHDIDNAIGLSGWGFHACALLADGTLQCWGEGGALGNGSYYDAGTPVAVLGIDDATAVWSSGTTCALVTGGELLCWGLEPAPLYAFSGDVVTWASSDTSVATVDAVGLATALAPGSTLVTATASGVTGNTTLTVNGPVADAADLALKLTDAPDPVAKNGTLVYTATITNNGPATAMSVRLNDTPPASVVVQSIQPDKGNCGFWGGRVKCWLGNLPSGDSVKVLITVKPQTGGWIIDYATTWSATSDPDMANNKAKTGTWVRKYP